MTDGDMPERNGDPHISFEPTLRLIFYALDLLNVVKSQDKPIES